MQEFNNRLYQIATSRLQQVQHGHPLPTACKQHGCCCRRLSCSAHQVRRNLTAAGRPSRMPTASCASRWADRTSILPSPCLSKTNLGKPGLTTVTRTWSHRRRGGMKGGRLLTSCGTATRPPMALATVTACSTPTRPTG